MGAAIEEVGASAGAAIKDAKHDLSKRMLKMSHSINMAGPFGEC